MMDNASSACEGKTTAVSNGYRKGRMQAKVIKGTKGGLLDAPGGMKALKTMWSLDARR